MSDTKYKTNGWLNNGYYVDEQALESLMKKILQQQENLRRDAQVAKLESILDIEVCNTLLTRLNVKDRRPARYVRLGIQPLTNHYLVDPTHKVLEDLRLF